VSQAPKRPRVLLADDYPAMTRAVARLLSLDCEVVGTVTDGAALIEAAARLQPDVVVVDLNLPTVNGLEACRRIRGASPQTKTIIFTAVADPEVRDAAFAAGAAAVVLKQSPATELLSAVLSSARENGC
jgi:DNA-binding NarL/FixJ family response regulator